MFWSSRRLFEGFSCILVVIKQSMLKLINVSLYNQKYINIICKKNENNRNFLTFLFKTRIENEGGGSPSRTLKCTQTPLEAYPIVVVNTVGIF